MSGIAGLMTTRRGGPDPATLAAMTAALRHRGAGESDRYVVGNVGMAQNGPAAAEPATDGRLIVDASGAALIADGAVHGADWKSSLHRYRREGIGFIAYLRGMYALALHDPRAGHLVLARDPFGIKPLYYAESDEGIAFASQPRALIAAGFAKSLLDPSVRAELLELQFTTRGDTIYPGIKRLLPGETVVVADGRIVERQRRAALPADGPADWSEADALARVEAALMESVRLAQHDAAPWGVFLSGGIGSSVLATLAARVGAHPMTTLAAYFPGGPDAEDRAVAASVARTIGAEHIEVPVDARMFWSLLPRVAEAMDDPAADYACVPAYALAERARAAGLKTVLSWEGADELFAGHGRYRSLVRPWWLGGRAMRRKGIFEGLGVLRERSVGWRDGIAAAEATERVGGRSRLQVAQAVDCADWLSNDPLAKLDRCLMANGIEGRAPFLDPAVAAVAFRLPDRLKVRDRKGKWLLRKWLQQAMPQADAFARRRGTAMPVAAWIAAEGARLGPLVAAQPGVAELADPDAVVKLFRNPRKHAALAAWTLMFYALWHQLHVLGRACEGDAFDCLATTMERTAA